MVVVGERERVPMLYHKRLCPPFQGAAGVGHDYVAGQSPEVGEESRVDQCNMDTCSVCCFKSGVMDFICLSYDYFALL